MAKKKKYNKISVQGNVGRQPAQPGTKTIILTQTRRGGVDVGDYMKAVKSAENVDFPSWSKLFDIYEEALTDSHLFAVIQKRKSSILNTPIEFKRGEKTDDQIGMQLHSPWFRNFLSDLLDTIQYGFSVFQFFRDGKWVGYDMIPRKHVNPVKRMILSRQTDIIGESFDDYKDLVMVGNPRDLGLLSKAALYVIYKRNAMADWAQFVELYGHPLKEGIYDGWDEEARNKMTEDLYSMGGSAIFVHPKGTEIVLHDNQSKSASSELYSAFIQLNNDEMSKLELGNTLTTEVGDKGSQALGTVHQSVEDKIERADRQMVLDVLNYELTDIFTSLGMNTAGGEFSFVVPQNKDLSARILIDEKLKNNIKLPMSDEHFYETYGVEKPKNYEELKALQEQAQQAVLPIPAVGKKADKDEPDDEDEPDDSAQEKIDKKKERTFKSWMPGIKNWLPGFFVQAPTEDAGASDW